MKRSAPLRRGAPLKRTSRLNPISKKRRLAAAIYSGERRLFLAGRPRCEVCDKAPSCDVHHKAGRLGTNYLDRTTWIAVCRCCHDWIHRNPKEARARGLLV